MKVVGKRTSHLEPGSLSPAEALRRAAILQASADRLNPYSKPRGFVFKARTRADYERWRRSQENPRLW